MRTPQIYNFSSSEYEKISTLADFIYNTTVVLDFFCSQQKEIYELLNISPIVETLHNKADILNSILLNKIDSKWVYLNFYYLSLKFS